MVAAAARASSRVPTAPRLHGATGTPTSSAISLAPILSPSRRIASALGPMKVTPAFSHSSAKAGSSAPKPQATQGASAPASTRGGQIPDGVDEPHCGLSAFDDGDPTKHQLFPPPYRHCDSDADRPAPPR